ncbi:MAG: nucleotidyl transferase AbiEii/AbiGii toxin family protein [Betaproteobacteria bacterium]|nr:nucleotidyl transferase AbiEii/AbiGii toxin family protein [Betaproteobacteria bacterium]
MFYTEFFQALEEAGVRYLVVGGIAVNLHGINRFTADIDLMLAMDAQNLGRFVPVAKRFGMKPVVPVAVEDLADAAKVRDWIQNKHMLAFGLRPRTVTDPTVDILTRPEIDFEAAWSRRVVYEAGALKVPVASIADMIAMKTGTGRQKDEADIVALQRLTSVRASDEGK